MKYDNLKKFDEEIFRVLEDEKERQSYGLELIASENIVSEAVLEAVGTIFTNKYAEGYPGKRYYGGCVNADVVENIARDRVKEIFGAEHANVQPHSGSNANFGVYFAMLEYGDTVLGMDLSNGGHLTHGSKVNMSGKYYNFVSYGLNNETEMLDYDEVRRLANEHRPKMIVAGASAYSREIDFKIFRDIADEVGAYLMVDMAHIAGLVAAGLHMNPVPYADFVTSTTHKTLRGPRGGIILCKEKYGKAIDKAIFPGIQGGPLIHVIAGKAVCFKEALSVEFKDYQNQVLNNSRALARNLIELGYKIVSNGTDNHMFLLDLTDKGVSGKDVEALLEDVKITVNKNTIPNETRSPFVTSGIRIGTPSLTTRGMKEKEMEIVARLIDETIAKKTSVSEIRAEVDQLCKEFPIKG